MITIEHLKKEYPNVTPLRDVNAEIKKGEVISVIGPSGTGKSTLLRCINLLETPTAGKIWVDGECITKKGIDICAVRRKMGMVFQSFNLFSHLSVIENIMLAPVDLLKMPRREAYDEAMRLLQTVGLSEKAMSYPDSLSGGQKQRIAIARALAMKPEIMLFDEPTSALDPTMVGEVLAVIRALAREGMTMMIVTHEMKFARDVSTRIFYMDEGEVYEDGTPSEILDNPKREKTRVFVKRLKTFERSIASGAVDFLEITAGIEEFGRKHILAQRAINNMQLIFEEICIQTLLKRENVFPIKFCAYVAESDGGCTLNITYGGTRYDVVAENPNDMSVMIASHMAKEYTFEYDGNNMLTFVL